MCLKEYQEIQLYNIIKLWYNSYINSNIFVVSEEYMKKIL